MGDEGCPDQAGRDRIKPGGLRYLPAIVRRMNQKEKENHGK